MAIEIDIFELQVLNRIKNGKSKVQEIPVDTYYTLLAYCEEQEDYETCGKLKLIEDKISNKTMFDYFDEFVKEGD